MAVPAKASTLEFVHDLSWMDESFTSRNERSHTNLIVRVKGDFSSVVTVHAACSHLLGLSACRSSIDQSITAELKEGLFSALAQGSEKVTFRESSIFVPRQSHSVSHTFSPEQISWTSAAQFSPCLWSQPLSLSDSFKLQIFRRSNALVPLRSSAFFWFRLGQGCKQPLSLVVFLSSTFVSCCFPLF